MIPIASVAGDISLRADGVAGDAEGVPQVLCPDLIGRVSELDVLIGLLDGSGTGVVLGEAGIGKSRLVRELVGAAQRRGLPVLAGRAVQGNVQPTPYRPLAEAVLSACRRGLPEAADLLPYRPALGRLIPDWYRPELASLAESSVVLGEGVLRLLAALGSGRPVLLVLEDLHWADPESLAVLEYLADHASEVRLACVVTARPGPGPALDRQRAHLEPPPQDWYHQPDRALPAGAAANTAGRGRLTPPPAHPICAHRCLGAGEDNDWQVCEEVGKWKSRGVRAQNAAEAIVVEQANAHLQCPAPGE